MFRGFPYDLPPWSVSILPDCKTEYYNTAKVNKLIAYIQNVTLYMIIFYHVQLVHSYMALVQKLFFICIFMGFLTNIYMKTYFNPLK